MLSGLVCVRRCMWVKFTHRNTGLLAAFWRLRKSTERSANSSSQVSIRFLVSGPASLMVCLPILPKRGSHRRVVFVARFTVQHVARSELREEIREVLGIRVIRQFRLFGSV